MSVSKPMYDPRYCDGEPCVGDCDLCSRWQTFEERDDEEDGLERETFDDSRSVETIDR